MDHLSRSLRNLFVWSELDRATDLRKHNKRAQGDPITLSHPEARLIPVWNDQCLVSVHTTHRLVRLELAALPQEQIDFESLTMLGMQDGQPYFAADVFSDEAANLHSDYAFEDVRKVSSRVSPSDAALIAYAKAMIYWHKRHRFCGSCGSSTKITQSGHLRLCMNDVCGQSHFPRTDSAIIVRVVRDDKLLLARQANWPPNRCSVIAGFVEPGESVEHAVMREVWEETNLQVHDVHYESSQPWPFPGSLMLGYSARTDDENIILRDGELEQAAWYSRQDIRDSIRDGSLRVPTRISIAYRLVEDWYDMDDETGLESLLATH